MILGIDSATEPAGVALNEGDAVLAEVSWLGHGAHSRRIDGLVRQLFELHEGARERLSGIAVAVGPGSFNGVRVGVSFGKGLALGLAVPVAGVSTLDAIGFQASWWSREVCALIPAGRGEVYTATYSGSAETWQRVAAPRRALLQTLADAYRPGILLAGPAATSLAALLRSRNVEFDEESPLRAVGRAAFLAELGRRYFDAGGTDQLDSLELLYLRRSSAEERREAGRE